MFSNESFIKNIIYVRNFTHIIYLGYKKVAYKISMFLKG